MPNFTTLVAGAWFNVPNINYGTPAATATTYFWANGYVNYFAVRFLGYIDIPAPGIYTFRTTSDDGSKAWVNGTLVVNNDHVTGSPVTVSNTSVVLTAGMQPFELQYFQRKGSQTSTVPQPDTTPPVINITRASSSDQDSITSTGARVMITIVLVGSSYQDAGATAFDAVDGNLTSQLGTFGAAAVDTSQPTASDHPFIVTYDVTDAAGNAALTARRRVIVACKLGEKTCISQLDGSLYCSSGGQCLLTVASSSSKVAVAAPTMTLVGPAVVAINQGQPYSKCPVPAPTDQICERGAQAQSSKDGVLTARIEACSTATSRYLFAQVGLRGCTLTTDQPGNFTIVFSVADSLGQTARVARQVVVVPVCPAGEHLCADKASCSQGGVCVSDLGSSASAPAVVPANTPPTLVLRTTPLLSALVSVKQGKPYAACAAGQIPVVDKLCELGVNATDAQDGDLTARVLACPAAACLGQGCPGYEFRAQGISSCAVNTSAAVGTQFNITFTVFDLGAPSLNASITRTVVIISPCPTGQTLCSDNSCSINCALSVPVVVERAVPIITLLPAPVTGAAQILYGAAANTSLLPCPTFRNRVDCGAVAVDADGNDVTGSMAVVDVTPCPANVTCSGCDITYANIGLCLPGSYLYMYRARDSQGKNAGTLRTVQVLDVYNVQADALDAADDHGAVHLAKLTESVQDISSAFQLFMNTDGAALLYDSQTGTAFSAADSIALLEGTQAASSLQPFGVDPVFLTSSSIYRSDIAGTPEFYYNTTSGSGEISPYGQLPYAFYPRPFTHFPDGFPVVVQTDLSADGARRLLQYLHDANFLDKYTATLAMRLLTYNPNSGLIGYARVDLTWLGAGQVQVVSHFSALPQLDYNTGTRAGRLRLATDTALVLLALVQAVHVTSSVYGRVQAWRNVLTKYALPFQLSASYDVYDALTTAPARILLPKKMATADNIARVAKQSAKADNSTFGWASQPGKLGRWSLPDDNTGLNELGAIYFLADKMTDLLTLYNFLQGMVLLLLLVAPELFNLMIAIVIVGVLLGAFGHLCFGHFEDRLTTPSLAVSGVFETMFSQQLQFVTQDLQSETTFAIQMNWLERALAFVWYFIVAIYTIIILWNFIIPVIRLELGRQRKAQGRRVPGIPADLLVIATERLQRLRGAPSNDAIGELVAVVAPRTRKSASSIWSRLRSSGLVRDRAGSVELAGIKVGQELFDAAEMRYALTRINSAPADLPAIAETIISRFGEIRSDWPEEFLAKRKKGAFATTILKAVRDQKALDARGQQVKGKSAANAS
ncbi:hypothetical protein WJX72_006349 [[Myrmecia] bisecta]|uniref:PA14 domain-containing protein n=1 Tax=[Myrmecia] bisecta TaxID=41462 RepID=A0AAW1Q7E8_9CHLO